MDDTFSPLSTLARELLRGESHGVLSTLSTRHAGYPFGSLTPYALSSRGSPIILISALAEHTANLNADPRASLFVADSRAAEPQAAARLTLVGRAAPVAPGDVEDARARYLSRFPQAAHYFSLRDFQLWQLDVEEARLVGGFGRMAWLPAHELAADPSTVNPSTGE